MSQIEWHAALDRVEGYVAKIATPSGFGTGFVFAYSGGGTICCIATAAHLIGQAHLWEEPLRVTHHSSGKSVLLHAADRAVFLDEKVDSAALVFQKGDLPFPPELLPVTPTGKVMRIANEVGWVGFPVMSQHNLCFFSGRTSCWLAQEEAYLVDGVVINGVSGGPAFWPGVDGQVYLVGIVSAYIPNTQSGASLPGLGVVRHVRQLQETISLIQSLEQAQQQQTPPSGVEGSEGERGGT